MGFKDQLAVARVERRRARHPAMDKILDSLDPEDRLDLLEACLMPDVMSTSIAAALNNLGHPISESALKRFRKDFTSWVSLTS